MCDHAPEERRSPLPVRGPFARASAPAPLADAMRVAVNVPELDVIVTVDVAPECTLDDLKAAVACEFDDAARVERVMGGSFVKDGRILGGPNGSTLRDAGVLEDDVLAILSVGSVAGTSSASAGAGAGTSAGGGQREAAAAVMAELRANETMMAALRRTAPDMARMVDANDVEGFARKYAEGSQGLDRDAAKRRRQMEEWQALATADPFDVEAQRKIEEAIRMENVQHNLEIAQEETPEVFAQVTMLYVDVEVNGTAIKAFVDSGAQMSIMSVTCARKCGLERLIDTRFQGMARGVGTQKIIGRVHQAPLKVGNEFVPIMITVLEKENDLDFIFGLDMLRRHACSIDLRKNALLIGSVGVELPFLSEAEVGKAGLGAFDPEDKAPEPTVTSAPAPTSAAGTSGAVDEEKVSRLMALGFDRQQVISALSATDGNEELAGALLFG